MAKNSLQPTLSQSFRIVHDEDSKGHDVNFSAALARASKAEQNGNFEEACEIRFRAVQELVELLPEDEAIELDLEDRTTLDALTLCYLSAVDFFLVGDWEMAAAQLEMVLDVDSDDHLEATTLLAFTYVAMQEWDSFDDIVPDLSEKSPERSLLILWSDFLRTGQINQRELAALARYHAPYLKEWRAAEHPTDSAYVADISSERPSREAQARELWLQTEHLWLANKPFLEALKA